MQWSYPIDETVTDFLILRGISGGPLTVVKTVSLSLAMGYDTDLEISVDGDIGPQQLVYQDTEVHKGKRYVYQVMARHIGGTTSQRSQTLTKKIPNE